jgi:hypothetical protein
MFHTYVASVSSGCCICFTHMLQVFHLDAAYVLQWLHTCFPRVLDVYFKCFNSFEHMLQMFPLDVTKIDLALHMLQWVLSAAVACCSWWACLHARGCGGVQAAGAGNRAIADQDGAVAGHGAARAPTWSKHRPAGGRSSMPTWSKRGHPDASLSVIVLFDENKLQ